MWVCSCWHLNVLSQSYYIIHDFSFRPGCIVNFEDLHTMHGCFFYVLYLGPHSYSLGSRIGGKQVLYAARQYGLDWKFVYSNIWLKKHPISTLQVKWKVFAHEEIQSLIDKLNVSPWYMNCLWVDGWPLIIEIGAGGAKELADHLGLTRPSFIWCWPLGRESPTTSFSDRGIGPKKCGRLTHT